MVRTSLLGSRHTSIQGSLVALSATAALLLSASAAHAEGSKRVALATPAAPAAQLASFVQPASANVEAATPAPVSPAAPPAGEMVTVVTGADGSAVISVGLGDHAGIDTAEAQTIREIVAHDLAAHHAPAGSYEVRIGKLGSKLLLILEHRLDREIDERHTLISGMEEVPVASPRLVDAMVNNKPMEDTQTANNVLTQEARATTLKQGHVGFAGSVIGTSPINVSTGIAGGAELGILYETDRFALTAHGRLAGGGSGESTFTYFNLGMGARYFISESDFTPYIGAGTGFSAYSVNTTENNYGASGMNLYGEVGLEAFRSHRVSMLASVRVDAPLFNVTNDFDSKYALPVSLNVGMAFK